MAVVDQQDRGRVRRHAAGDEGTGLGGDVSRDAELERGVLLGATPPGQGRPQQLGGKDAFHAAPRSGDELHDQIGGRARASGSPALRLDGLARVAQGLAQPVEGLTLLGSELGDERPGIDRAVAGRSPGQANGGGPAAEPFQRAVGIGARDARGVGDRIPGGWPQPEQRTIHLRLRGSEAEGRQIDQAWHVSSSISYYGITRYTISIGIPSSRAITPSRKVASVWRCAGLLPGPSSGK